VKNDVKRDLKSQLHIKFVLPLGVVAATGVAIMQLGLIDKLTGSDDTASAASPVIAEPATTTAPEGETVAAEEQSGAEAVTKPTGAERLDAALEKNRIVVVLVYSPDSQVDALATTEARTGATDANAGFLGIDASKERAVSDLATAYDIRETPTLLIAKRVDGIATLANKVNGWADRQTVAQLVEDARRAQ
jgi:hypothetical protein